MAKNDGGKNGGTGSDRTNNNDGRNSAKRIAIKRATDTNSKPANRTDGNETVSSGRTSEQKSIERTDTGIAANNNGSDSENRNAGISNDDSSGSGGNASPASGGIDGIDGSSGSGGIGSNDSFDSSSGTRTKRECNCKPPGQRGRHKRECPANKQRQIAIETDNVRINPPKNIGGSVLPFPSNVAELTAEFRRGIEIVWSAIYQIPLMMGYGEWWALSPVETKMLAESTENVLKSVPFAQRKFIMEAMQKYVPLTAFASTLAVITVPRFMATQTALAAQKGKQSNVANFTATNRNEQNSGANQTNSDYGNANREDAASYVGGVDSTT